jgi:hypothetical protein
MTDEIATNDLAEGLVRIDPRIGLRVADAQRAIELLSDLPPKVGL